MAREALPAPSGAVVVSLARFAGRPMTLIEELREAEIPPLDEHQVESLGRERPPFPTRIWYLLQDAGYWLRARDIENCCFYVVYVATACISLLFYPWASIPAICAGIAHFVVNRLPDRRRNGMTLLPEYDQLLPSDELRAFVGHVRKKCTMYMTVEYVGIYGFIKVYRGKEIFCLCGWRVTDEKLVFSPKYEPITTIHEAQAVSALLAG